MNNQRRWKKDADHCCAEFGAEDGIDPRYIITQHALHRKHTPALRFHYVGVLGKGVY